MMKTLAIPAALAFAGALTASVVPGLAQDNASSATSELCVYASSAEGGASSEMSSSSAMPSSSEMSSSSAMSSSAEMSSSEMSAASDMSSSASSVDLTTSNNDCLQSGTVSSSAAM